MNKRQMLGLDRDRKLPVILLIDDDMVSREVTATVLTLNGYLVYVAADGASALEMIADGRCVPELILADAQMPGVSGVELINKLRGLTRARLFAVSGSEPPAEVKSAADGFLLKPFDVSDLEKLISSHWLEETPPSAKDRFGDQPVVSGAVLAQLRSMMPEQKVREILKAVVVDLGNRIRAIETAIRTGNVGEIKRIGHAVKGGCAMAGAVQASYIGALLEELPGDGQSNQLDNSAVLVEDLRAAAGNLERMLEAELPT